MIALKFGAITKISLVESKFKDYYLINSTLRIHKYIKTIKEELRNGNFQEVDFWLFLIVNVSKNI